MECNLRSHPDRLLKEHLHGALSNGMGIFSRNGIYPNHDRFLSAILILHDLGKASDFFQHYILDKEPVNEKLKRHAEISALWFYFYAIELLELSPKYSALGYIIIKYHHADFINFNKMCIASLASDEIFKINDHINYDEIQHIIQDTLEISFFNKENFIRCYSEYTPKGSIKSEIKLRKQLSLDEYLFLNYFFSILLTADKADAIMHREMPLIKGGWKKQFVDVYKKAFKANGNVLNQLRNQAYDEIESNLENQTRLFSINLPTGGGKTLSVLNAALKLKSQAPDVQRIIYCLPFTSVIDQNAQVFTDVLKDNGVKASSDILLKQHHLAELSYTYKLGDEDKIHSSKDSEFLTEGWESEFITTTFYQLLHTLLSDKNRILRKFHHLTNSIIILDEVQAIPHKFWELIRQVFSKSAAMLNIRFLFVTATMPLIFSEKDNEIKELAVSKHHYFNLLSRIRLNTACLAESMHLDSFNKLVIGDIEQSPQKSRLIILNTIKSALEVFNFLKKCLPEKNIVFLSSNIIPKQRLDRIHDIKSNPKGKIVVSTQLVEAGVDIDLDVVYRDLAPLDSIFQACGRCNRNNDGNKSEVKLFILTGDQQPFYSYIYDDVLIDATLSILKQKEQFDEKEFLNLSREYFNKVSNLGIGKESDTILKNMGYLLFKNAFNENNGNVIFKLIESFPVVSTFIEYDENAKKIYQKYTDILQTEYSDPFQRRVELKTLRREMASYMINVPEKNAKNAGYDERLGKIWFVTSLIVDNHYDQETGFKRDQEVPDYIF